MGFSVALVLFQIMSRQPHWLDFMGVAPDRRQWRESSGLHPCEHFWLGKATNRLLRSKHPMITLGKPCPD